MTTNVGNQFRFEDNTKCDNCNKIKNRIYVEPGYYYAVRICKECYKPKVLECWRCHEKVFITLGSNLEPNNNGNYSRILCSGCNDVLVLEEFEN